MSGLGVRRALRRTIAVALAAWLSAARLAAQPAPDGERPEQPELVAPVLIGSANVEYPDGADGDATVILEVTVNADGTVRSARVVDGDEPFGTAAVAAARGWRFRPGTRAGQPVAATIRFELTFAAPTEEPVADSESPAPPREGAADGPPTRDEGEEDLEVLVEEDLPPPGTKSLSKTEVRQLPGAFGDPFRAIEILPGVTPVVSGLPYFYVRGAPPGNVGYYLDGVRVPYLYHVALGPSVIHPALVERVDLYPGGYPARYGRFAGGIVAGETAEPNPLLRGEASVRLFDAGALVEAGFAEGRGTVLLGGRYSYTSALFSLFVPQVFLDYRDYQARISYDVTPRDRVTLFSFGSFDLLGQDKQGVRTVAFGAEFYRLDLRYDHFYGNGSRVRLAGTLGFDQSKISGQQNSIDRIVGGRMELNHVASDRVTVRAGADTTLDSYDLAQRKYFDPDDPRPEQLDRLFPSRQDMAIGGHLDVVAEVAPGIFVTPGLRVDLYTQGSQSAVGIDPRIAARFEITERVRILHAHGIVHQPPAFVIPLPGIAPATLDDGLQRSVQSSAGVEADLPWDVTGSVTLFNNAFFNLSDALGTFNGDATDINDLLEQRSMGQTRGMEFQLRRPFENKLGGFLSYTLSRSLRSAGRENFIATFDRTHVANGAVGYQLPKKWRIGPRLTFYSGIPKLAPTGGLALDRDRTSKPGRSPPFYRVDVRLEKRWDIFSGRGWLSFVFEVLNATASKETFESETSQSQTIGPITIPSIGLEGGF